MHPTSRTAVTSSLVLLMTLSIVMPAAAQDPDPVVRLAGETRIDTAIAISGDIYAVGEAEAVVLAREDDFADALSGGPLAAARRGPLLLTPRATLAPVVEQEIQRVLEPGGTVFLLGGTAALDEPVADRLREIGFDPVRLPGANRYETALRIAQEAAADPGFITISTGNDFPDALIAGSLASAFAGGVLVLTDGDMLPQAVEEYLQTHEGASMTSVGPAAAAAVPSVFNVAGDTPSIRSVVAAETFYERIEPSGVALASVERFPDGLSGAAHAFRSGPLPLLLTPSATLPQAHIDYVRGLDAQGTSFVYGGNLAINESVVDSLRDALQG